MLLSYVAISQSIDTEHSQVDFSVSNMKWKTVEGTISGMSGDIIFDRSDLANSKFNVSIDPSSINTENETRDNHLKNEDFLEVEKFKLIRFQSDEITQQGDHYLVKGKLTLHGITKEVSIPFMVTNKGEQSTFKGEFEINRFDYGVGAEKYKKTFMVGDMIALKINCVLNNGNKI